MCIEKKCDFAVTNQCFFAYLFFCLILCNESSMTADIILVHMEGEIIFCFIERFIDFSQNLYTRFQ